MGSRSGKAKRTRVDPVVKLAKELLLPAEQCRAGAMEIVPVANRTDADQKDSLSLKRTETVRRFTRVELLRNAGIITADQALACGWYATAYEMGFHTVGCTANYGGAGGGGFGASDLLARYKAQGEARENYHFARQAIPDYLIGTFEGIVLGAGRPPQMMAKVEKVRFSLAAFLLHGQIGHMLALAA